MGSTKRNLHTMLKQQNLAHAMKKQQKKNFCKAQASCNARRAGKEFFWIRAIDSEIEQI